MIRAQYSQIMTVYTSPSKSSHLCSCDLKSSDDFLSCTSPGPFLSRNVPKHYQICTQKGPKQKLLGKFCKHEGEMYTNIKFLFLWLWFSLLPILCFLCVWDRGDLYVSIPVNSQRKLCSVPWQVSRF